MRQYIGTHQLTVVTTDVTVNNIDFSKLHYTVRTLALPCVLGVTLVALCLIDTTDKIPSQNVLVCLPTL